MKIWRRNCLTLLACVALTGPADAACPAGADIKDWVPGGSLCLAAATYDKQAGSAPALLVFLHGDTSSGGPADYLFEFARSFSQPGVVSVALLRPGYNDRAGRTSQGTHYGRTDSYTPANIAAVGTAIDALKKHFQPRRTIVVGHSGGAAIAGVLIGKNPGLIQGAILVSCPCDIASWRRERNRAPWTRSESPSSYVHKVPASTTVVAITGASDDNTGPALAQDFVAQLAKRAVPARFEAAKGAGHPFTADLQSSVTVAVKKMLGQ
jgi:pimeloyl-ACP methyl ester carboxylesterase